MFPARDCICARLMLLAYAKYHEVAAIGRAGFPMGVPDFVLVPCATGHAVREGCAVHCGKAIVRATVSAGNRGRALRRDDPDRREDSGGRVAATDGKWGTPSPPRYVFCKCWM